MKNFGAEVILENPAYVHDTVQIYGKVRLREGSSIWPYAVIRAEQFEVEVGSFTNVQDFVMIHIGTFYPACIGAFCTIAHHATIHGATIGDNCLVGVNATIMDGCVIGNNCIIGGGAFLPEGTNVPENAIVKGIPGKVLRIKNSWVENRFNALHYHQNALAYARGEHRAWESAAYREVSLQEIERLRTEFRQLFPDDK